MKFKKVILCLKGGLGNQIFQIIAALNFCKKNKIPLLYIYTYNLSSYKAIRKFDIDLSQFKLSTKFIIIRKKNIFLSKNFIQSFRFINNYFIKIINESNIERKNIGLINIIDGYFQSKDFLLLDSNLKIFAKQFNSSNKDLLSIINNKLNIDFYNDFALHVRGSDFLNHQELVNNTPLKILKLISPSKLFVFTDDKPYAISLLNEINVELNFINDHKLTDYQEFILMMNFKNLIITNSTFSLTASLLNIQPDKNIWSPSVWYYSKRQNNDLLEIINYFNYKLY